MGLSYGLFSLDDGTIDNVPRILSGASEARMDGEG